MTTPKSLILYLMFLFPNVVNFSRMGNSHINDDNGAIFPTHLGFISCEMLLWSGLEYCQVRQHKVFIQVYIYNPKSVQS